MTRQSHISHRDLELLSAYLDGALSAKEASRLEARLRDDPNLQQVLDELRQTVRLMGTLTKVPAPRNFTLTPEMVGVKARPRAYPVMRFATAVAALAFLAVVGVDALTGAMLRSAMAPMEEKVLVVEAPLPEDRAFMTEGTPVEEPALEAGELPPVEREVEQEVVVEEEVQTFTGAAEEAPNLIQPTLAAEAVECMKTATSAEELARAPAPPATATAVAVEPAADEDLKAVGAEEILETEPAGIQPSPVPVSTPVPSRIDMVAQAISTWPVIRWVEIGLGAFVILLVGLTLWVRRKTS